MATIIGSHDLGCPQIKDPPPPNSVFYFCFEPTSLPWQTDQPSNLTKPSRHFSPAPPRRVLFAIIRDLGCTNLKGALNWQGQTDCKAARTVGLDWGFPLFPSLVKLATATYLHRYKLQFVTPDTSKQAGEDVRSLVRMFV